MTEEKASMTVALRGAQESLVNGQYQEVVKLCKIVLKQDRNNYDGYVLLGSALLQLKQYGPAEKALRMAVGVNASKMAAWQRLVEVYEATGNSKELVGACQATRERAQALGRTDRYLEYTRKLVLAHSRNSDYDQACTAWQEILDTSSLPEAVVSEAICCLADAKSSLLEKAIQEEYKKRLQQDRATRSSGQLNDDLSSSAFSACADHILQSVEEEFVDGQLSDELENLLRKITSQIDNESEHHHELLLRLLLRRFRASRKMEAKDWMRAKSEALQQCMVMILSHRSITAFEVGSKFLEDDDGDEILGAIDMLPQSWKQRKEPAFLWFGRFFAHIYPEHGLPLAALACAMHCRSSHSSSLERKRFFCEKALRLEDNCATGWQVLAEIHVEQSSYGGAVECVRRGRQAISRSRAKYGLSLRVAELRLQLILGQTHLASRDFVEAESAFQFVAEEANTLTSKEGLSLVVATNEGLAKVALARGDMELAFARLSLVLSLNPHSHWALAEQGWLAFQRGDHKDAVLCLEQAVALQPDDPQYHRRLGLLYWKAGGLAGNMKDKALSQFLEAVKLDPSQSDVFRYLGHYYKDSAGDMQRATRCYQKSVTLDPNDEEAGEALCDLLDRAGQEVLEIDVCRGASQRSRRAFWAWRRLGFLQVHRKEWSEAVPNLQHALRGHVTDANLWEALGLAYQNLGMLTAALKAYGRAATLGNSSPVFALLQSGNILLLLASYTKAADMFQEALEKVPQHVGALCGLAAAMLGRARGCILIGAFSWGATLAKDGAQLLSASVTSCSGVGAFWKLLGDLEVTYAQALPCKISDSVNFSEYCLNAKLLSEVRVAIELWHQKRLSALRRAIRSYQHALHLSPSLGSLYSDLGVAFDLISSVEGSKTDSRSSWLPAMTAVCGGLRLDGDDPDLWVTLGMLTKHKGLQQHSFIQALRIDATHALAWGGLGQLYVGEGHQDLARDAFDRARSSNPALPLPWAGMAFVHSFIESEKDLQEAYASCSYAVQLSPTVEVQLGLGKLAARTHQLRAAEVYAALEQAAQHAPHRAEGHNLRGLARESRGDSEGAVNAFLLARYTLALQTSGTSLLFARENVAVSLNLARALCKAGAMKAAVEEYEKLAELGFLDEDQGALRSYAVALWEVGSKDKAVITARKSVEVGAINTVGGLALVTKMVYFKSGPSFALKEIQDGPQEALLNARYSLIALAVAVVCGSDHIISSLLSHCRSSFTHETSIQAHLLAASAKQSNAGSKDYNAVIQHLCKALHLYPQSCSLRARLGEMLLESSSGDKANMVTRCCGVSLSHVQHNVHYGSLCSTLAAAACACALCGQIESNNFSCCHGRVHRASPLLQHLQRWVHKEPWNQQAHYHLVLSLLQQARAQSYPVNLCRVTRRMAATALSMLPTSHPKDCYEENIRALLLVTISECALHVGDNAEAIQVAETALKFKVSPDIVPTTVLQLARCYAATQDYKSLQVELTKARSYLTTNNALSWLSLIELEQQFKDQNWTSSVEVFRGAILEGGPNEQNEWMCRLHLVCADGFIQAGDLWSAQKLAAEASALLPESAVLHLLHGALCLDLVLSGSNTELLSTAVRSLSRAVVSSDVGAIPIASVLLCKARTGRGNPRGGDMSKVERKLWTEWAAWPPECRPAELYFQMGLLAKKAQGTLVSTASLPEMSLTARAWLQRAVHLRPDSIAYWSGLQEQEIDS